MKQLVNIKKGKREGEIKEIKVLIIRYIVSDPIILLFFIKMMLTLIWL